jgi:hypothetical protein
LYCFCFGAALASILQTPFTGFGSWQAGSPRICNAPGATNNFEKRTRFSVHRLTTCHGGQESNYGGNSTPRSLRDSLPAITAAAQSGDLSVNGIISQAIAGGAGGAILTAIIGAIKNKAAA